MLPVVPVVVVATGVPVVLVVLVEVSVPFSPPVVPVVLVLELDDFSTNPEPLLQLIAKKLQLKTTQDDSTNLFILFFVLPQFPSFATTLSGISHLSPAWISSFFRVLGFNSMTLMAGPELE